MAPAYRYHRRFLQVLQWHHGGIRWLLKSPAHQWCLGDLFNEYPDATIVHTHRDPLKVIASTASLTAHLHRLASDHSSIPDLAAEWADHLILGNDRSVDARQDGTVRPDQAVDIHFRAVMRNPFGEIDRVYNELGIPFTTEAEKEMRSFLEANPADKHGVHRYTFAATELDEGAIRSRTKRYEDFFNVTQEDLD